MFERRGLYKDVTHVHTAAAWQIDNLHVRLIFYLGQKKLIPVKNLMFKISKIAKFGYEML
jgi:hypothetical protein